MLLCVLLLFTLITLPASNIFAVAAAVVGSSGGHVNTTTVSEGVGTSATV